MYWCNYYLQFPSFLGNWLGLKLPGKILLSSRNSFCVYLVAVFIFHSDRILKQLEEEQQSRKSAEEKLKELEG